MTTFFNVTFGLVLECLQFILCSFGRLLNFGRETPLPELKSDDFPQFTSQGGDVDKFVKVWMPYLKGWAIRGVLKDFESGALTIRVECGEFRFRKSHLIHDALNEGSGVVSLEAIRETGVGVHCLGNGMGEEPMHFTFAYLSQFG